MRWTADLVDMENSLSLSISRRSPKFISDLSGSPYSVKAASGGQDEAAVTMQKSYRGYRIRRQLADCAVLARDYGWWNVLEGICLRQTSEVHKERDDVPHRWIRAGKKAAKLGKGLSKDENGRKLAFQHWLEAIDARHRYGHNLHKYYKVWLESGTKEPFFFWLDIGEGRHMDLKDCPRARLFKEQIAYLGPRQRKDYEVTIRDGKMYYLKSGQVIDTSNEDKWIFLMSTAGRIYVGQKKKGKFQHSSFLAGGAAKAAGRLVVSQGILELIEPHSGHYRPTPEELKFFLQELENRGVDLTKVKVEYASREMTKRMKSHNKDREGECDAEESAADIANGSSELKSSATIVAAVVETLTKSIEDGASISNTETTAPAEPVVPPAFENAYGNKEAEADVQEPQPPRKQHRPAKLQIKRQTSCSWSTEGGARLTSLSIIPHDLRTRALEVVGTPREQQATVHCSPSSAMVPLESMLGG